MEFETQADYALLRFETDTSGHGHKTLEWRSALEELLAELEYLAEGEPARVVRGWMQRNLPAKAEQYLENYPSLAFGSDESMESIEGLEEEVI